ncbi:hypothetical protein [Candidatus Amarolinea dominans]|uniref:hypothetical protein n=1 Tax=Candidatus Amarolinea dominans TaxID=3140696 RepID=UPI0031CC5164
MWPAPPANTAMTAMTLDQLSSGRFLCSAWGFPARRSSRAALAWPTASHWARHAVCQHCT